MFLVCQALCAGILVGADHPDVFEKAVIKLVELASEHAGGGSGEDLNLSALHPESLSLLALVLAEAKHQHVDLEWDDAAADPNDIASLQAKIVACAEQKAVVQASAEMQALKDVMIASIVTEAEHWASLLADLEAPDMDDDAINIYVQHGNTVTPITVCQHAVLPQLRTKVEVALTIPAACQLFSFRKQPMVGVGSLSSFGVSEDSMLSLTVLEQPDTTHAELVALYHSKLLTALCNKCEETASKATFGTVYRNGPNATLHSSDRTNAMALLALVGERPSSDLVPKLVTTLLSTRKQDRWSNTAASAWVAHALSQYFEAAEAGDPNFVCRAWLEQNFVGGARFEDMNTPAKQINIGADAIAASGVRQPRLVMQKQGSAGRLYYSVKLRAVSRQLDVAAQSRGFTIKREIIGFEEDTVFTGQDLDVDNADFVALAGAKFRVKITVFNSATRHHVAVVDHLPAGFEHLTTPSAERFWGVSHCDKFNSKVQYFWEVLWPSEHLLEYSVLAATPGRFYMPPSHAEEMYCEETYGRCSTQVVSIVDADEFYQLVTKDGLLEICLCKDGVVIERKNVSHPGKSCTLGVLQELVWGEGKRELKKLGIKSKDKICLFGSFEKAENVYSYGGDQLLTLQQHGIVKTVYVRLPVVENAD